MKHLTHEQRLMALLRTMTAGYPYDPGDSDLDDEQPIVVRMTLGDYRRARMFLYELELGE